MRSTFSLISIFLALSLISFPSTHTKADDAETPGTHLLDVFLKKLNRFLFEDDVKVTGTILLDGDPVESGKITFHADNGQFIGSKLKDGKFTIDHFPTGIYLVTVEGKDVPWRYSSEDLTPLKFEADSSIPNICDFKLAKKYRD